MPPSLLICMFLFIVLAPCLLASGSGEDDGVDDLGTDRWQQPRLRGLRPIPLQAMLPETSLAEDFKIRSFPKGIMHRRIVVRDSEHGPRLTIGQVKTAALELIKLGGMAAAYEFSLVAAASALAMKSVGNAFAVAARQVMEAARSSPTSAWGDGMTQELARRVVFGGPTPIELVLPPLVPAAARRWREAARAA